MIRSFILFLLLCVSTTLDAKNIEIFTVRVDLPSPTQADLERGYVEKGGYGNTTAVLLKINQKKQNTPWRLQVKSEGKWFKPSNLKKATSHLLWKHNHEEFNAYRRLSNSKNEVYFSSSGEEKELALDLRLFIDWCDKPASYSTNLVFILNYL
jgi:hypothetical protein